MKIVIEVVSEIKDSEFGLAFSKEFLCDALPPIGSSIIFPPAQDNDSYRVKVKDYCFLEPLEQLGSLIPVVECDVDYDDATPTIEDWLACGWTQCDGHELVNDYSK